MPDKMTLIDGNNWLRRLYSTEGEGSALRGAYNALHVERHSQPTIIAWDGKNANKYRREIWPLYKTGRQEAPDGFYQQLNAFKRILDHIPVISIEVPEVEADDVIAALTYKFFAAGKKIHIKSTDKDFNQLPASYEGSVLPCEPEHTVLFKTMVGDTSDKIPGIPGFGIKKFEDTDKDFAQQWLLDDFPVDKIPEMPVKLTDWCILNRPQLIAMRDVCRFRSVSEDTLNEHASVGGNNPAAIEAILAESMS